ncbi:unnamed protein product [Spirodela intermedia]|uniref:NAD(P)-binding domain-containing protein n=1 Tax=Spirodela intermedia TaxID=51605 RepID=A0A7I8ILA7_SPIIN|nr:unnamed protein product [Spirodela intermedia]CAA6657718.1 unnamed protein product [Spirodela intermedia]
MELLSLQSPSASRLPLCFATSSHRPLERTGFLSGQPLSFQGTSSSNRCPDARRRLRFIGATGLNPKATAEAKVETSSKDGNLAFVAGATGRVGSRTVRELLKLGLRVRAGVRNAQRAETLLQSVKQMKLDAAAVNASETPPIERLELVECDLENQREIGPAIGDASVVICCIGASEKEVLDVTGPYRIDYKATVNLIDAATALKVEHFILLTSLGTNKVGFPAAILNLFWGVLLWKRKSEEALIASGLPYTIVRPGGMERPTDSFKETHNIVLANEDTYFGGLVSNLQVAELIAFMAKNRSLSFCKVVEVIAETTAPLTPVGELLSRIPAQREDTSPPKEAVAAPKSRSLPVTVVSPAIADAASEEPTKKTGFLSPYAAYEDLKPPTSPSPTPSSAAGAQPAAPVKSSAENGATLSEEGAQAEAQESSSRSPFSTYDDLKPPASPSPNAPVAGSEERTVQPVAARPLSPFVMYEDLKPPTSPTPSLPKY